MTRSGNGYTDWGCRFQSLFWWILYYDYMKKDCKTCGFLFQSLFWWILYYDNMGTYRLKKHAGFNPCFGGSYIMTSLIELGVDVNDLVSILVLVDLILWLFYRHFLYRHNKKFQSLFWWILYCDNSSLVALGYSCLFQSLFWWILYCDLLYLCYVHSLY